MAPVQDREALEAAAWSDFIRELADFFAAQWPLMQERLGERHGAFVEIASQQAALRGLSLAASVARYVNLCFVWGPGFHDKPGFEWAQNILAAPAEQEWATVHRLMQRTMLELAALPPGARVTPAALAAADDRLLERFDGERRRGQMLRPEPAPLPRKACDLEALELRLLDDAWHQEYRVVGSDWQRMPQAWPAPLRVDATRPLPEVVAVLTRVEGGGVRARLQARVRAHTACDVDVHPTVAFGGPHGTWRWLGHETRAVSWPVSARPQPEPDAGPGTAVAEETAPEMYLLKVASCGLRDDAEPLGSLATQVWAWPAAQWWLEINRARPQAQSILPGPRAFAAVATRCRVECDGETRDGAPLKRCFETGLDAALAEGVQTLAAAWEQLPGLQPAALDATLGVLTGRSSFTWGWRHGEGGLAGPAVMRLLGWLEMDACEADLQLNGELSLQGARARVRLSTTGRAPLQARLSREAALPNLAEVMRPATVRFRFPFVLELDPLATDAGTIAQAVGPVAGALVGEAGLRPRTSGGSGWEWFAGLRVEPVVVSVSVSDPLLGATEQSLTLLPALTLLDWSLR